MNDLTDPQNVWSLRLHERDEEYRQRVLDLDLAGSGIAPVGPTPKAPLENSQAFVRMLEGVNVERTLAVVERIHLDGYAIIEDLLDAATVDRLRHALQPLFADTASLYARLGSDRQTRHVHNVLAKTHAADEVAVNPTLRAAVAGVLGYDYVLNAGAVVMAPDPGCAPQGLHRDDGYYAHIPRPHLPLVLTVAVALDDFAIDNGATQVVPGSVTWLEDRQPEPDDVVQIEMPAGSALLWDGALLHGGGANRTQQSRRTLTLNYARGWLRTQYNQYLAVPRDRVLEMPEPLQADLGYHKSALGLGGVDAQDPMAYVSRLQQAGGDGAQALLGDERKIRN